MSFWAGSFWSGSFWAGEFWVGGTDVDGGPVNSQATSDVPTNYDLCQRTGFRQYPGELVRDGYGEYVRGRSSDERHPQDFQRSRGGDRQRGSVSPEQDDTFIATSIAPEDL